MLWLAGEPHPLKPLPSSSPAQEIAWHMKGKVSKCDHREYGFASVHIKKLGSNSAADALFDGLGDSLEVRSRTSPSSPAAVPTRV